MMLTDGSFKSINTDCKIYSALNFQCCVFWLWGFRPWPSDRNTSAYIKEEVLLHIYNDIFLCFTKCGEIKAWPTLLSGTCFKNLWRSPHMQTAALSNGHGNYLRTTFNYLDVKEFIHFHTKCSLQELFFSFYIKKTHYSQSTSWSLSGAPFTASSGSLSSPVLPSLHL